MAVSKSMPAVALGDQVPNGKETCDKGDKGTRKDKSDLVNLASPKPRRGKVPNLPPIDTSLGRKSIMPEVALTGQMSERSKEAVDEGREQRQRKENKPEAGTNLTSPRPRRRKLPTLPPIDTSVGSSDPIGNNDDREGGENKDRDGQTWIEILMILPRKDDPKKMKGRPLFYSPTSKTGVWFDPPKTARNVVRRKGKQVSPFPVTPSPASAKGRARSRKSWDSFVPRKSPMSARAFDKSAGSPLPDNDTWVEVVVDLPKGTGTNKGKKTRTMFYSVNTQRGVWDEPPTGASNVVLRKTSSSA